MSQKNCETLVATILKAIENSDFEIFLDILRETSLFENWDQKTRLLSEKLLLTFLLEEALSLADEFDDFLDEIEEMGVFEIDSEDQLVLDIGTRGSVNLSQIDHVISAINYIQSSCREIQDTNLTQILDLWKESKDLSAINYSELEKINAGVFARFKNVALANIQKNFFYEFESIQKLHDDEDSFYVGGASYTIANLNFSSDLDLASACSLCGQNLLVCKSQNCLRSYFYFRTGIDCNIDVYGITQSDVLLVSVSELGRRLARRLSERIPSVIGELKLYKNDVDGKVRLVIGSSFLIDYENHIVDPSEDYETLIESSLYLTHPLITEGDYLVVAWQEPWEIEDDTAFMIGLYKGEARRVLENLLG